MFPRDSPSPPPYELSQQAFDHKTQHIIHQSRTDALYTEDGFQIWNEAIFETAQRTYQTADGGAASSHRAGPSSPGFHPGQPMSSVPEKNGFHFDAYSKKAAQESQWLNSQAPINPAPGLAPPTVRYSTGPVTGSPVSTVSSLDNEPELQSQAHHQQPQMQIHSAPPPTQSLPRLSQDDAPPPFSPSLDQAAYSVEEYSSATIQSPLSQGNLQSSLQHQSQPHSPSQSQYQAQTQYRDTDYMTAPPAQLQAPTSVPSHRYSQPVMHSHADHGPPQSSPPLAEANYRPRPVSQPPAQMHYADQAVPSQNGFPGAMRPAQPPPQASAPPPPPPSLPFDPSVAYGQKPQSPLSPSTATPTAPRPATNAPVSSLAASLYSSAISSMMTVTPIPTQSSQSTSNPSRTSTYQPAATDYFSQTSPQTSPTHTQYPYQTQQPQYPPQHQQQVYPPQQSQPQYPNRVTSPINQSNPYQPRYGQTLPSPPHASYGQAPMNQPQHQQFHHTPGMGPGGAPAHHLPHAGQVANGGYAYQPHHAQTQGGWGR